MSITLLRGDCRELLDTLEPASVQTIITSPPYWRLRRYTDDPREIGREDTPSAYVAALVDVFDRCRRVLRDDGVLFLNLGDCYAGSSMTGGTGKSTLQGPQHANVKGHDLRFAGNRDTGLPPKSLIGIPWRVAFALQDAGWILRSDIIWSKPNAMPESVTDRPTRSHEYVFLFSKAERYYYDAAAIAEKSEGRAAEPRAFKSGRGDSSLQLSGRGGFGGVTRNARSVWNLATSPLPDEHYAPMPQALAERCIKAGSAAQACEVCGAPWARAVERESQEGPLRKGDATPQTSGPMARPGRNGANHSQFVKVRMGDSAIYTLGFAPTCACPGASGASASVVLDPFAGSGTTGRAALALQRQAILIDLAYTDLQERRTDGVQVQMVELL